MGLARCAVQDFIVIPCEQAQAKQTGQGGTLNTAAHLFTGQLAGLRGRLHGGDGTVVPCAVS